MKKLFAVLLVLLTVAGRISASDEARIFAEGNKAYEEKDFGKAIKLYESLMESGWNSPDLEYNLGNAWYRNGSVGRAVLHYERALLCNPHHAEAKKNLSFLETKIASDMEPLPDFFLYQWWKKARMALTATAMGVAGLAAWWLGCTGLGFWLLGKTRSQRKRGLWAGTSLMVASLLPIALALSRSFYDENTQQAILIQKSAILRAAPDETSSEVLSLDEGLKLDQVEHLEGWWQVRLPNGEVGWLPEQAIERI
jgi:tetratricopeptide (TPR) repeat protein